MMQANNRFRAWPLALALTALVASLAASSPSVAADLAVAIAAIASCNPADYALLLDAGVVPALLTHLPAAAAAEALWQVARRENGQEALWAAGALPKLLETLDGGQAAALPAARAIGCLAAHPDGQDAMKRLVARAAGPAEVVPAEAATATASELTPKDVVS